MTFEDMTIFTLTNTGKTLSMEILEYFIECEKVENTISKQGLSKQRKNIDNKMFIDMNDMYIEKYFEEEENKTFKGYNIIGVDGSTCEIPNTSKLKEKFGVAKASQTSVSNARASLNGFYDCLNQLMVKVIVDKYQVGEKKAFMNNVKDVLLMYKNKDIIFIFDRGYISLELLLFLEELKIKYLFRVPSNVYKKEIDKSQSNDETINIEITKSRLKKVEESKIEEYLKQGNLPVRLVKVEINTGEIEYLITNLKTNEIEYNSMKELYYTRWQIEKRFDILKNKLQLENLSSRSENGIFQEIYARNFLSNIIQNIANSIKRENKSKKNKYEYKLNINILSGVITTYFIYLICTELLNIQRKEERYLEILKFIKRNVIAIKTGNSNPRIKKVSRNKHKTNLRRNM